MPMPQWPRRPEAALGANADAFNVTCRVVDGIASFDRPERDLRTRLVGLDGAIYHSLTQALWRPVRVLSREVQRAVRPATLIDGMTGRYLSGSG